LSTSRKLTGKSKNVLNLKIPDTDRPGPVTFAVNESDTKNGKNMHEFRI